MNDPRPAFLFHVRDFWTAEAVELMSFEEVGVYLFLLSRQWETGSIPSDANALRTLCRRNASDIDAALRTVLKCFEDVGDGRLQNRRLEFERARLEEKSGKASASAKARWDAFKATGKPKKATSMRTHSERIADAVPSDCDGNASEGKGIEEKGSSVPTERLTEPVGSGASTVQSSKPENPKPSKPDPKKGDHVAAVEMFQRGWARLRHGDLSVDIRTEPKDIPPAVRYDPCTADWVAAASLWKRIGGDRALLKERMTNFFLSDAPYMKAGGFALFASKFSVLDQPIMALNGSPVPQE